MNGESTGPEMPERVIERLAAEISRQVARDVIQSGEVPTTDFVAGRIMLASSREPYLREHEIGPDYRQAREIASSVRATVVGVLGEKEGGG